MRQLDLKYNDYYTNINNGLSSLLASAHNADVTFAVEGKFFKAHQNILSIFSPYFRELFKSNPCQHPIFFLKGVPCQIMKDLLTFMYEGKVQIAEESFNEFVTTAMELKIKGLSDITEYPGKEPKGTKRPSEPELTTTVDLIPQTQEAAHEKKKLRKSLPVSKIVPTISQNAIEAHDVVHYLEPKVELVDAPDNSVSNDAMPNSIACNGAEIVELDDDDDDENLEYETDADFNLMYPENVMNVQCKSECVTVNIVRKRKGRSVVVNDFRYWHGDRSKFWSTWRCCHRATNQCAAVLCLTGDGRICFKGTHNHPAPPSKVNDGQVVSQLFRVVTMEELTEWRRHADEEQLQKT